MAQSTTAPDATQAALPSTGDVRRLTPEQQREILDNNTEEKAAAARGELPPGSSITPGIHGEVGVMVGSNGTHGIYGTAAIPLGENGGAIVSFESSHFGYPRQQPVTRLPHPGTSAIPAAD